MMSDAFCAAVDWGSTNLRIRVLDLHGHLLGKFESDEGLIQLTDRNFERTLERHLEDLGAGKSLPVVICGMAGSRQGWREVPYLEIPAGLADIPGAALRVDGTARPIHILPGLSQRRPSADVMRGEETQLLGLSEEREIDGVVCIPGTHSKWVRMQSGRIESFSTFMTGEVFSLLRKHSLLRFSVTDNDTQLFSRAAFSTAVTDIFETPAKFGEALFAIRGEGLLNDLQPEDATARLSGLCIGLELAGARPFLQSGTVELVASGVHAELYGQALKILNVSFRISDAFEASRRGLFRAAREIYGTA